MWSGSAWAIWSRPPPADHRNRGGPAHGECVTTPKRIQSGVPTGGQFAPVANDESAIELAEHTGGHPDRAGQSAEDGPTEEDLKFLASIEEYGSIAYRANMMLELSATKALAKGVLRRYPDAAYLELTAVSSYSDDDGQQIGRVLTDSDLASGNPERGTGDLATDQEGPLPNGADPHQLAACMEWDGQWEAFADADKDDGAVRYLRLREAAEMELPEYGPADPYKAGRDMVLTNRADRQRKEAKLQKVIDERARSGSRAPGEIAGLSAQQRAMQRRHQMQTVFDMETALSIHPGDTD